MSRARLAPVLFPSGQHPVERIADATELASVVAHVIGDAGPHHSHCGLDCGGVWFRIAVGAAAFFHGSRQNSGMSVPDNDEPGAREERREARADRIGLLLLVAGLCCVFVLLVFAGYGARSVLAALSRWFQ